jgi:hypothetical protein
MLDLLSFGWLLTPILQDGQTFPFLLLEFHERKIQYRKLCLHILRPPPSEGSSFVLLMIAAAKDHFSSEAFAEKSPIKHKSQYTPAIQSGVYRVSISSRKLLITGSGEPCTSGARDKDDGRNTWLGQS